MTERPPTAKDVREAWSRYKGAHNFAERPVLRLPLNPPMSVFDVVISDGPQTPTAVRHCVIRMERGWLAGQRAARLVGEVPGTDISVILETRVSS